MLTEERFAAILEELRMKNAVSVTELVEKLGASESTIRRDLNTLDEMGKLKKFTVVRPPWTGSTLQVSPPFQTR